MKAKTMIAMGVLSLAAWTVTARPTVMMQIGVPAPAVTVDVVPDYYVWDGVEYVGVVGSTCYYLDANDQWVICDGSRLARFHAWERIHSDWRAHETPNVNYRDDAHGHFVPVKHDNDREHRDYNHGGHRDNRSFDRSDNHDNQGIDHGKAGGSDHDKDHGH